MLLVMGSECVSTRLHKLALQTGIAAPVRGFGSPKRRRTRLQFERRNIRTEQDGLALVPRNRSWFSFAMSFISAQYLP